MMRATPPDLRTVLLTAFTLVAFASNSILCRLALAPRHIDAGTFTFVRLLSGAIVLTVLLGMRERKPGQLDIRWSSALALFVYAAPFSYAYLRITAGTGALILFGAVQATMIGWDLLQGKRLDAAELIGLMLAVAGLVVLTLPSAAAPDLPGAGLMLIAGVAWGVYSLLGGRVSDPLRATAGNFTLSLVFAIPLAAATIGEWNVSSQGLILAVASGALASGIGYAVWYAALRGLSSTQAGLVQLLVPVLAALGGVMILREAITTRLVISGAMIFAGVALAVLRPDSR
jgi:drug/metabolite transporter (DMT)-like permease